MHQPPLHFNKYISAQKLNVANDLNRSDIVGVLHQLRRSLQSAVYEEMKMHCVGAHVKSKESEQQKNLWYAE